MRAPDYTYKRALDIGKAAEHIVCADLLLAGYSVFLSDQGLHYDVVIDHEGRLFRVQVKGTLAPSLMTSRPTSDTPYYKFGIRHSGKGGKRAVSDGEFDILALVALDIRKVAYLVMDKRVLQTVCLRIPNSAPMKLRKVARKNIDQYPFEDALKELLQR